MPLQLLGATVKSPDCCRDFSMRVTPYGWIDNQIARNPRGRADLVAGADCVPAGQQR